MKYLGLEAPHLQVLRVLHPDRDSTVVEVASAAKFTNMLARKVLRFLEDRRFVRSFKVGKIMMYRRIIDLPRLDLVSESLLQLKELTASGGAKLMDSILKEASIREIVKGLWEGADVESYREFYYPIYRVGIIQGTHEREVWLDGRTGGQVAY